MKFLLLFISCYIFSQEVHVRYLHVRSPIATVTEDLYIKEGRVISIQDSIVNFNTNGMSSVVAIAKKESKSPRNYYISALEDSGNGKDYFFNGVLKNQDYFIHDKVPHIVWNIEETSSKKILGYDCVKATTTFRGSKMVAYFTKDLPYSAGPFKYYGLPGLILDLREVNTNYNIWKAQKVELVVDSKIKMQPNFKYDKITFKDFVTAKDGAFISSIKSINQGVPGSNVTFERNVGLEKLYEWETTNKQ